MEATYSILLVEDDHSLRTELAEFLTEFFSRVEQSDNAEEAYKLYENSTFDVVLTDIQLPKSDGLSLVKRIRKKDPKQLVVVMSAYRETEYFLRSIELGIFSFLLKPFSSQSLMEMLFKVKKQLEESVEEPDEEIIWVELASNIKYNFKNRLLYIDEKEQTLTQKEERLLYVLVKHMKGYLSDEQIALEVWKESSIAKSTLRVLVKRLRDRLGYENAITNLKGRGYRLFPKTN